MNGVVRVALAQVEPAIFDRDSTLDKIAAIAADVAHAGARLVLFPETFIPVYPSSRWARLLAAGSEGKPLWAKLARESVEVPSDATERIGAVAREHGLYLAVGVNERAGGTLYNALLVFAPDGTLALHHRKLMPTNHERLVWGLGDGGGLEPIGPTLGRVGGLICWENLMPLARAALYETGIEIYLAPTADDSEQWHESSATSRASRVLRALVLRLPACRRAIRTTCRSETAPDLLGRGGSAISARTASTSRGRSGTRRGSSTPTSTPSVCTRSGSGSTPRATTRGPDVLRRRFSRYPISRATPNRSRRPCA